MICHGCGSINCTYSRDCSSGCYGNGLRIGSLVLDDLCEAQWNTGKAHTVGALRHREFHTSSWSTARHPGTRGRLLVRHVKLHHSPRVLRHRSTPVQPALHRAPLWCQPELMVLPWLPTAEGASVQRLMLPETRKLSARPSASSRVVSPRNLNMHKLQTRADVAPRILHDTSAALWKAGDRSLDGYLSEVRQGLVLNHGSLLEAFDIHFTRVERAAAGGRGRSRRHLWHSCASPNSAKQWLH